MTDDPRSDAPPRFWLFRDLTSPFWLYVKGGLFLIVGLMSGVLLWSQTPTLWTALLLALTVWGFCRAYYFAFYVIDHYIAPGERFAGLGDFVRWRLRGRDRRDS